MRTPSVTLVIAATIVNQTLVVTERPDPLPGPGEVVVAVSYSALNVADRLQVHGHYPAPPGVIEDVPGLELSGIVVGRGDGVDDESLGRRVSALVGGGAHATRCVVPLEHLVDIPDDISDLSAGGWSEGVVTAHDALITQAGLRPAERVVISGASGGVGHLGVQIAALQGAEVVAVTRDHQHDEALRALGASEVVSVEEVDNLEPVDVVLELVGSVHLERVLPRMRYGGRVVVIGTGAGRSAHLNLGHVMANRLRITGSTLRWRERAEKSAAIDAVRRDLGSAWASGTLRVSVAGVFDLADIGLAVDEFSRPGKFGKILVRMPRE